MSFEHHIQKWASIDTQMKLLTEQMRELRDQKNELNETIVNHVEKTNLSNSTFQISDGRIKFIKVKDIQPLTFKYLESCLRDIIKNEEQVNKILEYIRNKREVKYVSEIKRIYNN